MTALAPYSLLAEKSCAYAPFLDHELFDFMSTLSSDILLDRKFHDDAIARAYPAFSHIPYANDKEAHRPSDKRVRTHFLSEATKNFLLCRPWTTMNTITPRAKLLIGCLSRGYIRPWVPLWIVYLDQIEAIIDRESELR